MIESLVSNRVGRIFHTLWPASLGALLLAGVGAASGCVIDHADNSAFLANWSVEYVGAPGVPVSCQDVVPDGSVQLIARNLSTKAVYNNTPWPCQAGRGVTRVLPTGQYGLSIDLLDARGNALSAVDLPDVYVIDGRGVTPIGGPVYFTVQSIVFNWTLSRGATPLTCAQAGARYVHFVGATAGYSFAYDFECANGSGQTPAIQTGSYELSATLTDAAGNPLTGPLSLTYVVPTNARAYISDPVRFVLP